MGQQPVSNSNREDSAKREENAIAKERCAARAAAERFTGCSRVGECTGVQGAGGCGTRGGLADAQGIWSSFTRNHLHTLATAAHAARLRATFRDVRAYFVMLAVVARSREVTESSSRACAVRDGLPYGVLASVYIISLCGVSTRYRTTV